MRTLGFEHADAIARKIIARFTAGEFDVATLFFSRFRSVIAQIPTAQQLVPAPIAARETPSGSQAAYEYEPGEDAILAALLPRNIAVQVFRALLENAASEQGARMSAMDNATRNAGDMIRKQTHAVQPLASGDDHQGTDRDHFGGGGFIVKLGKRLAEIFLIGYFAIGYVR